MKIDFARTFKKQFRKLSYENQSRVEKALDTFIDDPFSPTLRNHKLSGTQKGIHSISAAYDLRLLYREEGDHAIVLFIELGTHEKVYK